MLRKIANLFNINKETSAPKSDTEIPKPGSYIGGDYRVIKAIKGGMGYVIITHDPHDDYIFVLKSYYCSGSAVAKQCFQKEAFAWVNIGFHPNILQAYWVRSIDKKLYVAAEYVPADVNGDTTLLDMINRFNITGVQLACFMAQFCYGMMHAVKNGLVAHLDIKPSNILIKNGLLKIGDFGLAKAKATIDGVSNAVTDKEVDEFGVWRSKGGIVCGTPPYMAPEQFDGVNNCDIRADIYSFGITIWQCLTSRCPFSGSTIQDFANKHRNEIADEINHPLWPIVSRCLAKSPAERFSSFEELLKALKVICARNGIALPHPPEISDKKFEGEFAKAQSYIALGKHREALKIIEDYTMTYPNHYWGWTEKSRILLEINDNEGSLLASNTALALYPSSSYALNNSGVASNRLGRFEEAVQSLKKAIEVEPKNTGAMLNLSISYNSLKRYGQSILILERAIQISPEKASLWNNLGSAYKLLGNASKSAECYKRALQINPNLAEASDNLEYLKSAQLSAEVLIKSGNLTEAKTLLLDDTIKYNKSVDWHNIGILYLNEQNIVSALECFENVLKLSPKDDFAYKQAIQLCGSLGYWDRALEYAAGWCEFGTDKVTAICTKAQVLFWSGKRDTAISYIKRFAFTSKNIGAYYYILAILLEQNGEYSEALHAANHNLAIVQSCTPAGGNIDDSVILIKRLKARIL